MRTLPLVVDPGNVMPDLIEALHRLQDIERGLAVFRREEQAKQRRIEEHTRQIYQADRALRDAQRAVVDSQAEVDRISLEVSSRDDNIANHRLALSTAKTNKEYSAILTALNLEKADSSEMESQALEMMTKLDELRVKASEIEQDKESIQQRLEKANTALTDYLSRTAEERKRLEENKAVAADGLPDSALKTFNRVAEHHDGEAMAQVTQINPRRDEYCCGGCNMKFSLEVVNALHVAKDLQFCQVCGRILYLQR